MAELKFEGSPLDYTAVTDGKKTFSADDRKEKVIDTVQQVKQEGKTSNTEKLEAEKSVTEVVEDMNKSDALRSTSLQFIVEERGESPIVKVLDKESGETIRQIPSELAVKLSKALEELTDNNSDRTGILFDKQV